MEGELGHEIVDVLGDKRGIASHALTADGSSGQTFEPAGMRLCLPKSEGMSFLKDLVDCNKRLEGLNLISKDGLPVLT